MKQFKSKMPKGMTPAYVDRMAKDLARSEATGKAPRLFKTVLVPIPAKPQEVRDVRKTLGLDRAGLAEVLGLSAETVKAWELGKRTPDSPATKLLRMMAKTPRLLATVKAA